MNFGRLCLEKSYLTDTIKQIGKEKNKTNAREKRRLDSPTTIFIITRKAFPRNDELAAVISLFVAGVMIKKNEGMAIRIEEENIDSTEMGANIFRGKELIIPFI